MPQQDDVRLREVAADDEDMIAEFYEALDERAKWYYWPSELNRDRACTVAATADGDEAITVLATQDVDGREVMLGYNWFRRGQDGGPWYFGICIRPGAQSQGLGTKLLGKLVEIARSRGITRAALHVHLDNLRALKLYRKYGFREQKIMYNQMQGVPQYYMEADL